MNFEDKAHERLSEFGAALVDTLAKQVTSDGQIVDPGTDEPVPDDHYANSCFAVAGLRAAARSGSESLRQTATRSLQYYLSLGSEKRGHGEFNSLALLELIRDSRQGRYELPVPETQLTDTIEFESTVDSRQGNNWLLLRGLCHYRLADLYGGWRDRLAFQRICRVVKYWTQDDGVVADSPRFPVAPVETPMTYHAKLATLCAHLGVEADNQWLTQTALDGFRALSTIALPSGESLYYGRSENTLFGYATALDGAFRLPSDERWLAELRYRLASHVLSSFNPKRATCRPGGELARSVDDYVYDGVYSAYAAMVLLGLSDGTVAPPRNPESGTVETLDTAGLTAVVGNASALGVASEGQVKFTDGVPDPRYSGLVPLSFTVRNNHVCPGVPSEFLTDRTPPYLPVAVRGTDQYVPVVWSAKRQKKSGTLTITGEGNFYPVEQRSESNEDSKSLRNDDQQSFLERFFRTAARKAKVPLYLERRRKRSNEIPVTVRRAVHFLTEHDMLVVQTATATSGEWTILPTSFVVDPSYEAQTTVTYAESSVSTRTERVHTPHGIGTWIRPEKTVNRDEFWSTVIVDPNGMADTKTVERGASLQTTVSFDEDASTLDLHRPKTTTTETE